jgi:hypothetical protein
MNPSCRLPGLLLLTALAASAGGCKRRSTLVPGTDYAQPLRLEFRPRLERTLTETVTLRSGPEAPGAAAAVTELALTTATRFSREGQAWVLSQRITELRLSRGGTPVDSPLAPLLQSLPLRVQLARDGAFVRVLQPEAAEPALAAAQLAPEQREAAQAVLEADAQQELMRREWTAKYGGLFGRNLPLGQKLYALDAVAFAPEGPGAGRPLAYVLERTLSGTLLTDYGEALVFSLRCLGQVSPDAPPELRALVAGPDAPALEPSVTCEGEQVIARGTFVPVRSRLHLRAGAAPGAWTWSRSAEVQDVED